MSQKIVYYIVAFKIDFNIFGCMIEMYVLVFVIVLFYSVYIHGVYVEYFLFCFYNIIVLMYIYSWGLYSVVSISFY